MSTLNNQRRAQAGFTLVELAIVLVIIGLIIGGVLVGQDMIKGAEVRATAGQFEKYSAAVNTFKDKYRQIPGDLNTTVATQFGFLNSAARGSVAGQGDGNGLLEACATGVLGVGCESIWIWEDLSTANLIDGSFTQALVMVPAAQTSATIPALLPTARMGRGNYIQAYGVNGYNYYQLGGITAAAATTGAPTLSKAITPQEAYNIDSKLDDGRPGTGSTQAVTGSGTALNDQTPATLATTDGCTDSTTFATSNYKTQTPTSAGTPACALRVRFN